MVNLLSSQQPGSDLLAFSHLKAYVPVSLHLYLLQIISIFTQASVLKATNIQLPSVWVIIGEKRKKNDQNIHNWNRNSLLPELVCHLAAI